MRIKQFGLILLPGILVVALQGQVAGQENKKSDSILTKSTSQKQNTANVKPDTSVQQSDIDDVRSQVLVLDEFINRLLDRTVARTNRPLTLSGTISSRYSYIKREQGDSNTFSIPSAILNFRGTLFKDYQKNKNLTFALGFSSSGGTAPTVTDANLAYSILPNVDLKDPQLNVTLGQQKSRLEPKRKALKRLVHRSPVPPI